MDFLGKKVQQLFRIRNKIFEITKGDSAAFRVDITNESGEPYTMQTGDTMTFTVRKRQNSPILLKIVSTSNTIDLLPSDTHKLEVGSCCFEVQVQTSVGDVFTVAGLGYTQQSNMIVYPDISDN